jgi:hypothetical protein
MILRTCERSGWRNVFLRGREYHMKLSFTFLSPLLSVVCTRDLFDFFSIFCCFTKYHSSHQTRDDPQTEHSTNEGRRSI